MRPIVFSTESVRKILDGKKTMTRRVIEPQHPDLATLTGAKRNVLLNLCPYGAAEDTVSVVWVQEKWRGDRSTGIKYQADEKQCSFERLEVTPPIWHPATNMPYWASRIQLKLCDVRVEQLQEISVSDVLKEGFDSIDDFKACWNSLNEYRGYGWNDYPYVYVIEFKQIK